MPGNLQVMLAGRTRHDLDELSALLRGQASVDLVSHPLNNGHADPLQGVKTLPDLLVLVLGTAWEDELQALAARPAALRPPMIVISRDSDARIMRRSMQAGARDFFVWPVPGPELQEVVAQIARDRLAGSSKRRLTVFVNAKGGSGATTLACNSAHLLAAHFRQTVALLDLDLQFGTLPLYFDLRPSRGLLDTLEHVEELDIGALGGYLARHGSGLHLLGTTSTDRLILPGEVSPQRLGLLLDLLSQGYGQIVIDLPRQVDALTGLVTERADQVVVVLQQTLTHIRDAKRLIGILQDGLEVPSERILLMINRFDPKSEISVADVEKALARDAAMVVPNDFKGVSGSINAGIPLYDFAPKSPVTKALQQLTAQLGGIVPPQRRGLLGRLFSSSRSG